MYVIAIALSRQTLYAYWEQGLIHCPNHVSIPFEPGKTVHFPTSECSICPLRERCTTSVRGRNVSIHPDEAFMQELRERQDTEFGRAKLRQRSLVEHTLAHMGQWQGDRARYTAGVGTYLIYGV
ncbi:hypothetical protein SD81_036050 [Tolypothrix campylonemoides VB511288]|nr:hypothetical protein SD81_036050 [Tolypothrix campylonemoides VB511288]